MTSDNGFRKGISVFISYARADDEPFVERLHGDLEKAGIKVWWDRQAMESRGRTFLQEIRDAIEGVDRVIAVIGPRAVASDYVRCEWEHASLFAKEILPVLRCGDYDLIPDAILPEGGCGLADDAPSRRHAEDFRDDRRYDEALDRLIEILREPVPELGALDGTPALPPHFLPRQYDIRGLEALVLTDVYRPTIITSAKQTTALEGMGGVGKSVLASAFARATKTRRAFNDGIIWLTSGRETTELDLLDNIKRVGLSLNDDTHHYLDELSAQARLPVLLANKVSLIVLDDVWSPEQMKLFVNSLGPRCRLLITTRDRGLVTAIGAQEHSVDLLGDEEALKFLSEWSAEPVDSLPSEAKDIVQECGNLPLALAMVGAMVRDNPDRWANALHRLRHADLEKIKRQFPNYPYPDLLRAIQVSVDFLDIQQQARYRDLAVFPEHTLIPEAVLQTLWAPEGLDEFDTQDMLDLFVRRSLARRDMQGRITLHDLQYDYVTTQVDNLPDLYRRLLRAYEDRCQNEWANGPDDGYFFQHLPYHLVKAGHEHEARGLLLGYDWLQAKLQATSVPELLADFAEFSADRDIALIRGAIELSASTLDVEPGQLSSQLIGRLWNTGRTTIESLCRQIVDNSRRPWLRPLTKSLVQSGGSLRRRLLNTGDVTALDLTPDGRYVVTIGGYGEVKLTIWDLEQCFRPRTFSFHGCGWPDAAGFIRSIFVSPDGKRAVVCFNSISRGGMRTDNRLAVLDLENCAFIGTLKGHWAPAKVVAFTTDGRCAVSAGYDRTVRVWDLEGGSCLHVFEGHSEVVNAIEITKDQRRVVSVADDGTLRIWDLRDGSLIHALGGVKVGPIGSVAVTPDGTLAVCGITAYNPGHLKFPFVRVWNIDDGVLVHALAAQKKPVTTVAVDADGIRAFSGSWDGSTKVWDLKTGRLLRQLLIHKKAVTAIGISPDGCRAMTASKDNTCKIWDLESGTLVHTFSNPMWAATHRVSQLGTTYELPAFTVHMTQQGPIAISSSDDGSCRLWNIKESEAERNDAHGAPVNAIALIEGGRYVISTADDGRLWVWDVTRGEAVRKTRGRPDDFKSGAWKERVSGSLVPDMSAIALASCSQRGDQYSSVNVAVGSFENGGWPASVSDDGTLKVWDAVTGVCVATFTADTKLTCVAAVGRIFAAGSMNGAVHVVELMV